VGEDYLGSAVTVGSGVPLNTLYQASKAQGKVFVGGTAATVVPAGGYFQGAGHSALSPTFGLLADNTLGMFASMLSSVPLLIQYAQKYMSSPLMESTGVLIARKMQIVSVPNTSQLGYHPELDSLLGDERWGGGKLGRYHVSDV
jgi:hypothetical protein